MAKKLISAGELDRQITIQRFTSVPNEYNEPVETWADYLTVRAKREDTSDLQRIEMIAAGQVGAFTVARFTIRYSPEAATIKPIDRVLHEGKTWSINGVKEATQQGRFRYLEITAVRDADV